MGTVTLRHNAESFAAAVCQSFADMVGADYSPIDDGYKEEIFKPSFAMTTMIHFTGPIQGEYALHGGANWLTVGKPLTLGCLRATDASILELIAWLESRGALAAKAAKRTGEKPQPFTRPARFVIR